MLKSKFFCGDQYYLFELIIWVNTITTFDISRDSYEFGHLSPNWEAGKVAAYIQMGFKIACRVKVCTLVTVLTFCERACPNF